MTSLSPAVEGGSNCHYELVYSRQMSKKIKLKNFVLKFSKLEPMARLDQDYERFVQNVYQMLSDAEGKKSIKVERNVKLKGISGQEHQIDVYWKYKQAGIIHEIAVECKLYKQNVGVGKIRDFQSVLTDVPGLRGVFATKSGYQSGAKRIAQTYNIGLLVIREPEERDYDWKTMKVKGLAPYANLLRGSCM